MKKPLTQDKYKKMKQSMPTVSSSDAVLSAKIVTNNLSLLAILCLILLL